VAYVEIAARYSCCFQA